MKRTTYILITGIVLLFSYWVGSSYWSIKSSQQQQKQKVENYIKVSIKLTNDSTTGRQSVTEIPQEFQGHFYTCFKSDDNTDKIILGPRDSFINIQFKDNDAKMLTLDGEDLVYNINDRKLVKASPINMKLAALQDSIYALQIYSKSENTHEYQNYTQSNNDTHPTDTNAYKEYLKKYPEQHAKSLQQLKDFCLEYRETPYPAAVLYSTYGIFNYDELNQIIDTTAAYWQLPMLDHMRRYYNSLKNIRTGKLFTDIETYTIDGKLKHLSDWFGKDNYVLMFTNWGYPCPRDCYLLEQTYKQYKKLDILQISRYNDYHYWKYNIKEQTMPWTMTCTLGKNLPLENAYSSHVLYILFNPQGKIEIAHSSIIPILQTLEHIFNQK